MPLLSSVGREIKKRANITNTTASPWKAMMRPGSNVEIKLNEKARKELGFEPAVNFRKGIERAVAWYREQGWL